MEVERTEFGFKATVPLITEDEIKIINNDFDNKINKFLKMIIKDKDLAIAQYIMEKQQEQMNELKRNSIPKKKIEDMKEELEEIRDKYAKGKTNYINELQYAIDILKELLEDKNYE